MDSAVSFKGVWMRLLLGLSVESCVHEKTMHVRPQEVGSDEVLQSKILLILMLYETFLFVIDRENRKA